MTPEERQEFASYRAAQYGIIRGLRERIDQLNERLLFWKVYALGITAILLWLTFTVSR